MGHRWFSIAAIAASTLMLFSADLAWAEGKPHGGAQASGRTRPRPAPLPNGATSNAAPAAPIVKTVCVRPKGVDKSVNKWTFGETNKPVTTNVEETARRLHNYVYSFDEHADLDSPKSMPVPFNVDKCPNDKRQPAPAPEPKPEGILPKAGPLFASANPLGPSTPILAPASLGSSGTGKTASMSVAQFIQTASNFQLSGTPDEISATNFARKLRDSIVAKNPLPEVAVGDLSLNAAEILAKTFGEDVSAALAQQPIIAPLNVLQKMVPGGKNANWHVFALVTNQAFADREIIAPDEAPAVVLSTADHQHRTKSLVSAIPNPLPDAMLRAAFTKAYADKPEWLAAIGLYL